MLQTGLNAILKIINTISAVASFAFVISRKENSPEEHTRSESPAKRHQSVKKLSLLRIIEVFLQALAVVGVGCLFVLSVKYANWVLYPISIAMILMYISILYHCFFCREEHNLSGLEYNALSWTIVLRFVITQFLQDSIPYFNSFTVLQESIRICVSSLNFIIDIFHFLVFLSLIFVSILRKKKIVEIEPFEINPSISTRLYYLEKQFKYRWVYIVLTPILFVADFIRMLLKLLGSMLLVCLNLILSFYNTMICRILNNLSALRDTFIVRITIRWSIILGLSIMYIVLEIDGGFSEKAMNIFAFFSTVIIIPTAMASIDSIKENKK